MSALRDLYVGITLDDNASRPLRLVDREVDNVRDGFSSMNRDIDDSSNGFNRMGSVGSRAMNDIEDEAEDAEDAIDGIGNKIKNVAKSSGKLGIIASGFSGIVAAVGPAIAGVGALGASLASAGIGAVAFGAVAGSVLKPILEDTENLTKVQQKARDKLENFQSFWGNFTKQFETPIFEAFGKSLTLAQNVLKGFAPTITEVSGVVNELLTEMNASVDGGGLKSFFSWMETTAASSLSNFAHIAGNTMSGFFNLLQGFAPLGTSMENGMLSLAKRFKDWSAEVSGSTAFQSFVDYARTNGPTLISTLGNIGGIIGDVAKSLAPLGTAVLNAANEFTNFIQESETIQSIFDGISSFGTMIQENWGPVKNIVIGATTAFVAFKGIMTGMTIVSTISGLITGFRTALTAATAGQWAFNASLWASPITWVVAGIAGLIAIGVLLWKNWDTVKLKAYALWEGIKFAWNSLKTNTIEVWGMVKSKIGEAMDSAKTKVTNFFSPLLGFIASVKSKWDNLVSSFKNFKMPKIGLPKWMGGNGLIQTDGSHATGLERVPYDGYTATVHKDESILTAKQSNALRDAGILKSNSGRPALDMQASSSGGGQVETQQSSPVFQFYISGENSKDIAQEVRKEVENIFAGLNLST
jgi:hypothetical protein